MTRLLISTTVLSTIFCSNVLAADSAATKFYWLAPISAALALVFAIVFYNMMMKESEGTDKMKEIAQHVREGAMAYLSRQYKRRARQKA